MTIISENIKQDQKITEFVNKNAPEIYRDITSKFSELYEKDSSRRKADHTIFHIMTSLLADYMLTSVNPEKYEQFINNFFDGVNCKLEYGDYEYED